MRGKSIVVDEMVIDSDLSNEVYTLDEFSDQYGNASAAAERTQLSFFLDLISKVRKNLETLSEGGVVSVRMIPSSQPLALQQFSTSFSDGSEWIIEIGLPDVTTAAVFEKWPTAGSRFLSLDALAQSGLTAQTDFAANADYVAAVIKINNDMAAQPESVDNAHVPAELLTDTAATEYTDKLTKLIRRTAEIRSPVMA